MRIVRFQTPAGPGGFWSAARYGLVDGDAIVPLACAPWETGGSPARAGDSVDRRTARLLCPAAPSKIICVGRNYVAHAKELGNEPPSEPLFFFKAPSSLLPHGGTVQMPPESERVDFEGEMAIVIGQRARRLRRSEWRRAVFGFTVGNDVTARDLQKKDGQWSRSKSFDTFCPLGPAIETEIDTADLKLETTVNGVVKQSGRTSQMIFDLGTLLEAASAWCTLEPGDVILTGTPEGVGPLQEGDEVTVTLEKIGALVSRVAREG